MAILATLSHNKLKIKMDSQAAIDDIKYTLTINRRDKWLTINNRTLLANICELIRKKNIKLELIKVKAHTGIVSNEIANELTRGRISRVIDNLKVSGLEVKSNCIRATLT